MPVVNSAIGARTFQSAALPDRPWASCHWRERTNIPILLRTGKSALRSSLAPIAAALIFSVSSAWAERRLLDATAYHLGTAGQPEWQWFERQTPFSKRLDIHFRAESNQRE